MTQHADLTAAIKALAVQAGFARVGVAAAGEVADGQRFRQWLARGWHGTMDYLARHAAERLRPERLVAGARSVICLAAGYAPGEGDPAPAVGVARYARGRDYHKVLQGRCRRLIERIRRVAPGFEGRGFVDSAPLLERSLAAGAGVGWIGRNCCLVVPGIGSYVFLCEVVCNLPLRPDAAPVSGCEDCGACLRACPTGALTESGLDARRCVGYLTVEHRGAIDRAYWPRMGRRLVGCDACQEACPHNRRAPAGDAALRAKRPPLGGATLAEILAWSRADWDAATTGSAARRVRHDMLLRNAVIAAGNSAGRPEAAALIAALGGLLTRQPVLGDVIEWALQRLCARGKTSSRAR
jgi:epoxyqueuosine reductase